MTKISFGLLAVCLSLLVACNDKGSKDAAAENNSSAATETESASDKPAAANQPKSYTVTFSPDTAILGKSNEALVKAISATAVALTDPDGKDNGIEFVVKLQATNKQLIGQGNSFSISYSDSRLQLDNGTNIPAETGSDYLRAEPESSSKIESWTYQIPANAKPTALNLFMAGTRVSLGVALK